MTVQVEAACAQQTKGMTPISLKATKTKGSLLEAKLVEHWPRVEEQDRQHNLQTAVTDQALPTTPSTDFIDGYQGIGLRFCMLWRIRCQSQAQRSVDLQTLAESQSRPLHLRGGNLGKSEASVGASE